MRVPELTALLEPVVGALGLEVDRIEIAAAGKRSIVRVYVDGDGASGTGPNLDEVTEATRAIGDALDASPITGEAPYVLEVSSRGVSRPLTAPRHFRRNTGRLVALTLADGQVTGRILSSDADGVRLDVDGTERAFAYADIAKAVVQVEMSRADEADEDADEIYEEN